MNLTLENTTNKYKRTLTQDVLDELVINLDEHNGKNTMEYLIMVGKSDNLAQNPKMTSQSLKLLDVMTDMLNCKQNNVTKN